MNTVRSGFVALVAVAVLVGTLAVLIPSNAQAATVNLTSNNVGQIQNTNATAYIFSVNVPIVIPAGEHLMLTAGKIVMANPSCIARSDGSAPSPYTTFSVTPAPVTDHGYAAGTYGNATRAVSVVGHFVVHGCLNHAAFGTSSTLTPTVQASVGPDFTSMVSSSPVAVQFYDPNAPAAPAGTHMTVQGTPAPAGQIQSGALTIQDASNAAGTSTAGQVFPVDLSSLSPGASASIKTVAPLPAGSQILIDFAPATAASLANMPFGLTQDDVAAKLRDNEPAFVVHIGLSIPGQGTVSATDKLEVTFTFEVPASYFTAGRTPSRFQLVAYTDSGDLENPQPRRVDGPNKLEVGAPAIVTYQYTYRITAFSSFVGFASIGGGGGGGGGGSSVVVPTETGTPVIVTKTETAVVVVPGTETSKERPATESGSTTSKAPGLELVALLAGIVGAVVLVRRRI